MAEMIRADDLAEALRRRRRARRNDADAGVVDEEGQAVRRGRFALESGGERRDGRKVREVEPQHEGARAGRLGRSRGRRVAQRRRAHRVDDVHALAEQDCGGREAEARGAAGDDRERAQRGGRGRHDGCSRLRRITEEFRDSFGVCVWGPSV